jgi:hypothetical protein
MHLRPLPEDDALPRGSLSVKEAREGFRQTLQSPDPGSPSCACTARKPLPVTTSAMHARPVAASTAPSADTAPRRSSRTVPDREGRSHGPRQSILARESR